MKPKTYLQAIKELEPVVLSKCSTFSTAANIREHTREECRDYYHWLRRQAPMTSMFLPRFEELTRVPNAEGEPRAERHARLAKEAIGF